MKNFILKVLSNRDNFLYESLNYNDLLKIQDSVLNSLGFKNLNELRDRYEGVAFINRFSLKISGVMALEKKLKKPMIDWDKVNPKNYIPKIVVSGKEINVVMCKYGEFPVIEKVNTSPAIITVRKDKKDIWICGFADVKTLNENQDLKFLKGEMMKGLETKTTFVGFDALKPFTTYEELETLVNL